MSKVQDALEPQDYEDRIADAEATIEDLKVDLHGQEVENERLTLRIYQLQDALRSIAREALDEANT